MGVSAKNLYVNTAVGQVSSKEGAQLLPANPCTAALAEQGLTDACYTFEDTPEGLFSAVFRALAGRDGVTDMLPAGHVQPRLGQPVVPVATCLPQAERIGNLLLRAGGSQAFSQVLYASLSDHPGKGLAVLRAVSFACELPGLQPCKPCHRSAGCRTLSGCPHRKTASRRKDAGFTRYLEDLAHPATGEVARLSRAVANERHRMKQFLRFEHVGDNVWAARCNPHANVLPLLMDWFAARFNDERFVIYDETHHLAGLFDGARTSFLRTDTFSPDFPRAPEEALMQKAWRAFYDAASIEARYHPELRVSFMPKRLWRNIVEVNGAPLPESSAPGLPVETSDVSLPGGSAVQNLLDAASASTGRAQKLTRFSP